MSANQTTAQQVPYPSWSEIYQAWDGQQRFMHSYGLKNVLTLDSTQGSSLIRARSVQPRGCGGGALYRGWFSRGGMSEPLG